MNRYLLVLGIKPFHLGADISEARGGEEPPFPATQKMV